MALYEICIKRPVLTIVMSLVLLLLGGISFFKLAVREYPDIDSPIVSVTTVYTGASAETIETTITEPLEDEISGIEGIKSLRSSSREGRSSIIVEFSLSRDIDIASQDVRDRVARARGRLPDDAEEPIVAKQDADAQPIMWLGLSGNEFSLLQLSDYADRYLIDQFQTIPGVGRVIIGGERKYAMRVWLDPFKMAARGIDFKDVETALHNENVELPSGRIESKEVEFTVKILGDLYTPAMFNDLIIKSDSTGTVYLKDVGQAEIAPNTTRSFVRYNGGPAVGLGIVKQSKANTLSVAKAVKQKIKILEKQLPPGMILMPAFDVSIFIERSIAEVEKSLFVAGALVVLVILMFLGNIRSSMVPAIAIPISIVATFAIMLSQGFTINIITLLALTLAIGLVVDDAIIVLENIYRHMEMGKPPVKAAIDGTKQILFAVIVTTVAIVVVFVPIGFTSGTTGKLFKEFSIAVSGAIMVSSFVALTLVPMVCSKILKLPTDDDINPHPQKRSIVQRLFEWTQKVFERFSDFYKTILTWTLDRPKTTVFLGAVFLLLGLALVFIKVIPQEFLPTEDRGNIITIIKAPEGATLHYTDKAVRQAEHIIQKVPEVRENFSVIALSAEGPGSVNEGLMFTMLHLWEKRHTKQQDIVQAIQPEMFQIPEAFVFPISPPSGPQRGTKPAFEYVLQGFDIQELNEYTQKIMNQLRNVPGLVNVDSDLKLNKPKIEVEIQRERAAELGISARDISRALQVLLGGKEITNFKINSKRYDVVVQSEDAFRNLPRAIQQVALRGKGGVMVPLANVVSVRETVGPKELNHYNRLRSATITAMPLPFISLGQALDKVTKMSKDILPPTIQTAFAGQSREYKDAGYTFYLMFGLALIFVYLVLAAQFESFIHPFVIILTVPLAISGALITLFLMGASINVYSQIGLVLLVGLATKNGILIVEFANQIREEEGLNAKEAVFKAAHIRLRPILMTAISVVFGAIPIAFATGAGAESRQPMGMAILGGMLFSTFLTLFLVPVVYQLLNSNRPTSKTNV